MISKVLIAALIVAAVFAGHSAEEWKGKVIYQVLTDRFARTDGSTQKCGNLSNYCGGTYRGLIDNISYIKELGFDAIWISPIVKNSPGGYHGYWMSDLYSLNENFGSEEDFREFINVCHSNGIWVMIDVVGNHSGPIGYDYGQINPFNKAEHYHDNCSIDP